MTKSPFLGLHINDFEKGLLVAIFSPILLQIASICNAVATGSPMPAIDLALLAKVAVASGAGYLVKNLLSNSQGTLFNTEPKPPVTQ